MTSFSVVSSVPSRGAVASAMTTLEMVGPGAATTVNVPELAEVAPVESVEVILYEWSPTPRVPISDE